MKNYIFVCVNCEVWLVGLIKLLNKKTQESHTNFLKRAKILILVKNNIYKTLLRRNINNPKKLNIINSSCQEFSNTRKKP